LGEFAGGEESRTHCAVAVETRIMKRHIYRVTSFAIVGPYAIQVQFDDQTSQTIDFRPVLAGELFGPLRDLSLFNKVQLDSESHTLVWSSGADFDPATLHDWPDYATELADRAKQWMSAERQTPLAVVAEKRADYGKP
jgi:hypothetical protein